jgi:CRISPR-associated protein Csd1
MLLKLLYDLAQSRKLLDDEAFEPRAIRWIINLDPQGSFVGIQDTATDGKRGKEFAAVPKTARVKKGKVAEFLADGIDSLFGLSPDPTKPKDAKMLRAKFEDFWQQIADAAQKTKHPGLQAVLRFKPSPGQPPEFLRAEGSNWFVKTAAGTEVRLGGDAFTFRVSGELLIEDDSLIRPYWQQVFERTIQEQETESEKGLCLITGANNVPLARTHTPRIGNIPNVGIDGTIVSFEKSAPAYSSYGKSQSYNAPCSISATRAYSRALQFLVDHNDHHVVVGKTKFCFWTRSREQGAGFFARLLTNPDPKSVRDFIKDTWFGIPRDLAKKDEFYAVTLTGNSGRIVVKHWLQVPLDQAVENFHQWFADLELFVPPRPELSAAKRRKQQDGSSGADKEAIPPLAIFRLACTTVREAKDLPPDAPTQLYRAALEGASPSTALLKPILDQLHSRLVRDEHYDLLFDESRFALLKLILNRNRKDNTMEIKPRLTADTDDPAYNCGRLLAVLAAAQDKAHDYKLEGAGVAERYFGTASVSPASVFPLLLRLNRHHLNKISKSERFAGHERFLQEQIQNILALFQPGQPGTPPAFPRTLDLQAQGRFALGFYQQSAEDDAARKASKSDKPETAAE